MTLSFINITMSRFLISILFLHAALSQAGPATVDTLEKPALSPMEELWSHAVIYEDKENPYLQKVRILGRYHTNWASVDAEQGDGTDWETRRLRLGINAEFLEQFEIRNEWNITGLDDDEWDPKVDNIDTLFLTWKPSKSFNLTAGKHKAPLTQEFRTSSNELLTIERTVLTQSFTAIERHWGISARGEEGNWSWLTGVWAGNFREEFNAWFDSSGPAFSVNSLGYDFGEDGAAWEKALLTLQYAKTEAQDTITPKFDNIISLNFEGEAGPWTLSSEFLTGWGDRELTGVQVMPGYFLTEKLQAVVRYQYATGDVNTLRLRNRYEGLVTTGAGDQSHSIYGGLNYYIHGHRAKLMVGAEYLDMEDAAADGGEFDGWTLIGGAVLWF